MSCRGALPCGGGGGGVGVGGAGGGGGDVRAGRSCSVAQFYALTGLKASRLEPSEVELNGGFFPPSSSPNTPPPTLLLLLDFGVRHFAA